MKILVVTQYFHPENFKINDLVAQMVERGHEVSVLTGLPNYPEGRIYKGFSFWRNKIGHYCGATVIRSALIPRGKGNKVRLFVNYLSFALLASLTAIVRVKRSFDIIFVYEISPITVAIPALVLKRIRKIPVVMWVQDLWPESVMDAGNVNSNIILNPLKALVRKIYHGCDGLLIASRAFESSIQTYGIPEQNIHYFPQWAEEIFEPFQPNTSFKYHDVLPSGFRVIFAGNMGEAQDIPSVINAAEKLRECKSIKWIFLGWGRCYDWAKEEIDRRALHETVYLLGRYPLETMPHFFAHADVMLLTLKKSLVFSLTVPAKIQTYMACGRPIVTMLDGEGSKIIEVSRAGLTARAGDYERLANNVLEMYEMPISKREALGRNGLHYCQKHFDRDRTLSRCEEVLQVTIEGFESKRLQREKKLKASYDPR